MRVMNIWQILLLIFYGIIWYLLGFAASRKQFKEENHIGTYDAEKDILYFDDGEKPTSQKIGVIDILYLKGRDEHGNLS